MYISPYDAYPFLHDEADDLRCDFELITDQLASELAMVCALCPEEPYRAELLTLTDLVYHANPTLRMSMRVTQAEVSWMAERVDALKLSVSDRFERFVLPQGSPRACTAHVARVTAKRAVRLLYRHAQQGHDVDPLLFDCLNLVSGYCFYLALRLNELDGVQEVEFVSRHY